MCARRCQAKEEGGHHPASRRCLMTGGKEFGKGEMPRDGCGVASKLNEIQDGRTQPHFRV